MLRIAICDDDSRDREKVSGYVDEYLKENGVDASVRVFDHPDALIEECSRFKPHIYILDIVMPMLTGIQAARELRWNQPDAQIIFATSEKSFALESFDVNPINYILKPVDRDKLFSTLDLARSRVNADNEKILAIKSMGGVINISIDDILYIEYRNHLVTYHLQTGEEISPPTIRTGFTEYLETNHAEDAFIRCHESIAVRSAAIDKLTKKSIILSNKEEIPVSKSRYQEVMDQYMDFRFEG